MAISDRDILKHFFRPGSIPLAKHFEGLADSALNQGEDGIRKDGSTALNIQAAPKDQDGKREALGLYDFFELPVFLTPVFSTRLGNNSLRVTYGGSEKHPSVLVKESGNTSEIGFLFIPEKPGQLVISLPDQATTQSTVEDILALWRAPATVKGDFLLEATSSANLLAIPGSLELTLVAASPTTGSSGEFVTSTPLETDDPNVKLRVKYTGLSTDSPLVMISASDATSGEVSVQFAVASDKLLNIILPAAGAGLDTVLAAWSTLTDTQKAGFSFEVVSEKTITPSSDQVKGDPLDPVFSARLPETGTALLNITYTGTAAEPSLILKKEINAGSIKIKASGGQLAIRTPVDPIPIETIMAAWNALPAAEKGGFSLEPVSQAGLTVPSGPFTLDAGSAPGEFVMNTPLAAGDPDIGLKVKWAGAGPNAPVVGVLSNPEPEQLAVQFEVVAADKKLNIILPASGAGLATVLAAWEAVPEADRGGFSMEIVSTKVIATPAPQPKDPKWKIALTDEALTIPGGLLIGEPTAAHLFIQSGTGNVGIGTSNPGAKLEVGGDIKANGIAAASLSVGNLMAIAGSTPANLEVKTDSVAMKAGENGEYKFHSDANPPGDAKTVLLATYDGKARGPQLRFQVGTSTGSFDIGQDGAGNFIVQSGSSALLKLSSTGSLHLLSDDADETKSLQDIIAGLKNQIDALEQRAASKLTVGRLFQEGIIFELDATGVHGKAAGLTDLVRAGEPNSGLATQTAATAAIGTEPGAGWRLPSKTELTQMFSTLRRSQTGGFSLGITGSGMTIAPGTYTLPEVRAAQLPAGGTGDFLRVEYAGTETGDPEITVEAGTPISFSVAGNQLTITIPEDLTDSTKVSSTATDLLSAWSTHPGKGGFDLRLSGAGPDLTLSKGTVTGLIWNPVKVVRLPVTGTTDFLRVEYAGAETPGIFVEFGAPSTGTVADFDTTITAGQLKITVSRPAGNAASINKVNFLADWNSFTEKGGFHLEFIGAGTSLELTEGTTSITDAVFTRRFPATTDQELNFLRITYTGTNTLPKVSVTPGAALQLDASTDGQLNITLPAAPNPFPVNAAFLAAWNGNFSPGVYMTNEPPDENGEFAAIDFTDGSDATVDKNTGTARVRPVRSF